MPQAILNFGNPDLGCKWMGVVGQVFGFSEAPVRGLVVIAQGNLNDIEISESTLTGLAPQWGPGGYEINLADRPIATEKSLWLEFYTTYGTPVSERLYIKTFSECNRNVILVNLVLWSRIEPFQLFLPVIIR
jgi:hypothetical protein